MRDARHTMFAGKALSLAETFDFEVGPARIEGATRYVPKISTPDGESTDGGKLALQHLSLEPEGGGPTIVVGHVNGADETAQIRGYTHIATTYGARFKGEPVPFGRAQYDAFVERARAFLASQHYTVDVELDAPAPAAPHHRRRTGLLVGIIAGAVVAIALAAAIFLLR